MPADPYEPHGDLHLARLHVDALFTYDDRMRIRTAQPSGRPAPRFFLSRTRDGNVWRCRCDLDEAIAHELQEACAGEPIGDEHLPSPHGAQRYEQVLARSAPVGYRQAGPAYAFPSELPQANDAVLITPANADLLCPYLEDWRDDVLGRPFLYAMVIDGCAVSVCTSSRTTASADEAGVATAPPFRGRGLARRAVSAWARAVRDQGRVPLYSTSWENTASQALARSLGLARFAADVALG